MHYTVIESDGELVMLSAPQWKVMQQAKHERFAQANVQTLRKLADLGFLENVAYVRAGGGDPKPYGDFTAKSKRIVYPPSEAVLRKTESRDPRQGRTSPREASCGEARLREPTRGRAPRTKGPSGRRKKVRVLVVFDGEHWFTRIVKSNAHRVDAELDIDEMVYRCDDLSGPHANVDAAVTWLRQMGYVP
jgi:hypothetical protein